ncbi:MAG: 5'/3'-nucleotidase SurE [bacterium]
MRLFILWIVFFVSTGFKSAGFAQVSQEPPPLDILLTNDDGYSAPGIMAMRKALIAAGHHVTLVAPAQQRSGSSVSITSGTMTFEKMGEGVWAVGGVPADAVLVGLLYILADRTPDLVISGSNFGQNISTFANSSGTIGAAIMAMQRGVPAIAVSVGILFEESNAQPRPIPSTFAAYKPAAAFTVSLVKKLQQNLQKDDRLLPVRTVLNVNYPALPVSQIKGVRLTQLGTKSPYRLSYRETETPGELRRDLAIDYQPDSDFADTTWFARGYITISVLDGNWSAERSIENTLHSRLSGLEVSTGR